jgi:hypothetical protein
MLPRRMLREAQPPPASAYHLLPQPAAPARLNKPRPAALPTGSVAGPPAAGSTVLLRTYVIIFNVIASLMPDRAPSSGTCRAHQCDCEGLPVLLHGRRRRRRRRRTPVRQGAQRDIFIPRILKSLLTCGFSTTTSSQLLTSLCRCTSLTYRTCNKCTSGLLLQKFSPAASVFIILAMILAGIFIGIPLLVLIVRGAS